MGSDYVNSLRQVCSVGAALAFRLGSNTGIEKCANQIALLTWEYAGKLNKDSLRLAFRRDERVRAGELRSEER